jgi:hypothetical protein
MPQVNGWEHYVDDVSPPIEVKLAATPVLGFMAGVRVVMKWDDDRYNQRPRPFWHVLGWSVTFCRTNPPTYWQHLPEPPKCRK